MSIPIPDYSGPCRCGGLLRTPHPWNGSPYSLHYPGLREILSRGDNPTDSAILPSIPSSQGLDLGGAGGGHG